MANDKKPWPWFCPLINDSCYGSNCWCFDDDKMECKNPMLNEEKKASMQQKNSIPAKYKK